MANSTIPLNYGNYTIKGSITAEANATWSGVTVRQAGHVIEIDGYVTLASAPSAGIQTMAGTITGVSLPTITKRFLGGNGDANYSAYYPAYNAINSSGNIYVTPQVAGHKVFNVHMVYTDF